MVTGEQHSVSAEAVREELVKILRSKIFHNSERISRFLRFTVETTLEGKGETLKEYVIGVEVYDRKPPYSPSQDSIVRTEAQRLRKKLKEYYETDGQNTAVCIWFRPGSYVPVFRMSRNEEKSPAQETASADSPVIGSGVPVAVLPFANISPDEAADVWAAALTHNVIHALIETRSFRVVSQLSVARLCEQNLQPKQVARQLGVLMLWGGTVHAKADTLKVIAYLLDEDGFQIWSQSFEAKIPAQKMDALLDRVASALVTRTRSLNSGLRSSDRKVDRERVHFYPEILRCEQLIDERTPESLGQALNIFERGLKSSPCCGRVQYGLARCYSAISMSGVPNSAHWVRLAHEAVLRGLDLDPELVGLHSCLGVVLSMQWSWDEAELNFRRDLEMDTYAYSLRQFATFLSALDRFEEGWRYLQQAFEMDSFSRYQKITCAQFLYRSRRFDEVRQYIELKAAAYGGVPLAAQVCLAQSLLSAGEREDAKQLALKLRLPVASQPALLCFIAAVLAQCGGREQADEITKQHRLLAAASPVSKYRQALLLLALERREQAQATIASAASEREAELVWIAVEPGFDPLRGDSAFQQTIAKIHPQLAKFRP